MNRFMISKREKLVVKECAICGVLSESPENDEIYCVNCGHNMEDECKMVWVARAIFCNGCGTWHYGEECR